MKAAVLLFHNEKQNKRNYSEKSKGLCSIDTIKVYKSFHGLYKINLNFPFSKLRQNFHFLWLEITS